VTDREQKPANQAEETTADAADGGAATGRENEYAAAKPEPAPGQDTPRPAAPAPKTPAKPPQFNMPWYNRPRK
jgi:hypothetical protein